MLAISLIEHDPAHQVRLMRRNKSDCRNPISKRPLFPVCASAQQRQQNCQR